MTDYAAGRFSLEAADPTYAQLVKRERELGARLGEIHDERCDIMSRIHAEGTKPQPVSALAVVTPIQVAARKLLGGLLPAEPVEAPGVRRADDAHARLVALSAEAEPIVQALDLLAEQKRAARFRASASVCKAARPEHAKRATALARAVLAMALAADEYLELAAELDAQNVAWAELSPITRFPGGHPRTPFSEVRQWLQEAVKDGHLEAHALPVRWREDAALLAAE